MSIKIFHLIDLPPTFFEVHIFENPLIRIEIVGVKSSAQSNLVLLVSFAPQEAEWAPFLLGTSFDGTFQEKPGWQNSFCFRI